MRRDRPRPIPVNARVEDIDHTTVRALRFPSTQGYAQPQPVAPVGDVPGVAGPDPAHVSRFNDYRGE